MLVRDQRAEALEQPPQQTWMSAESCFVRLGQAPEVVRRPERGALGRQRPRRRILTLALALRISLAEDPGLVVRECWTRFASGSASLPEMCSLYRSTLDLSSQP